MCVCVCVCVCVCGELCVTDETGTGGGVSECARVGAGYRGERVGWPEAPDELLELKMSFS